MPSCLILGEGKPTTPSGREWVTSNTVNVGEYRKNPGNRIRSLPSANGLLGGLMSE